MLLVLRKFSHKILLSILIAFFALKASYIYFKRLQYSDEFLRSLKGPISFDQPELIQYVKNEVLEPPSTRRYNLTGFALFSMVVNKSKLFYQKYLKELFSSKRGGFFVEAGALDGVAMSNTLWLETHQGWNGLLVEPDPANYIALKYKNRKAWTAKSCLSITKYPKVERLSATDMISGETSIDPRRRANSRIMNHESNETSDKDVPMLSYFDQQCIPLGTLLLAVNATTVDLLSLDVEFMEEKILRNFDFERFDIKVLFIEWWDFEKLQWLQDFMRSKGYEFVANDIGDIIYVKKNTEYYKIIVEKYPRRVLSLWKMLNITTKH